MVISRSVFVAVMQSPSRQLRFLRPVMRHAIVLSVLFVLASGAIGGTLLSRAFASTTCKATDRTYAIAWGDTLGGIAARFHTTVAGLASYNGIGNPNLIFAGQRVCIPGHTTRTTYGSASNGISVGFQSVYIAVARQAALNAGISPDIFVRQINQESGFRPNVTSYAGAVGIAQFMPATAASLGINPYNPTQALQGAARLMATYVRQYGSYALALAAYNAGPGTVNGALRGCGGAWLQCVPAETHSYVNIILG
jgi:LysM repeat protein